jgi:nitroimidazol reductase NimA-like FMN-containing flavoprotein (pyridoxamine 5'-phosphate oxidase superfamily)
MTTVIFPLNGGDLVAESLHSVRELPSDIIEVFDNALVCEFTVVSPSNRPVTHPLLPLYDSQEGRLFVTSSVLFSRKLDHIKKNPKVSALFSNKEGLRTSPYRIVLVKGDAKVGEEDVHHGWEKLLPLWRKKEPYIDNYVKMRYALPLFWERSVIEIDPTKVYLWPTGETKIQPNIYEVS